MPAPFTIKKLRYSEQKEPDTIVHYIEVWVYFIKQKRENSLQWFVLTMFIVAFVITVGLLWEVLII